jgi:hypothetical protein
VFIPAYRDATDKGVRSPDFTVEFQHLGEAKASN